MALIQGQAGPQIASDGSNPNIRQSKDASLVTQDAHGRYQEAVYRGNVFFANATTAQALTTLATTSQTGLVLMNPPGSGKNAVLLQVEWAPTVVPGTAPSTVILAVQTYSASITKPTQGNVLNAFVGGPLTTVCYATTSGQLQSTPLAAKMVAAYQITTATQAGYLTPVEYDIGGGIILQPGTAVCLTAVANVATGLASFLWEEIPV